MGKTQMEWWDGEYESHVQMVPVRTARLTLLCPVYGCTGEMVATGAAWLSFPAGNHHKCNKCGELRAISGQSYPQIVYEPIKE